MMLNVVAVEEGVPLDNGPTYRQLVIRLPTGEEIRATISDRDLDKVVAAIASDGQGPAEAPPVAVRPPPPPPPQGKQKAPPPPPPAQFDLRPAVAIQDDLPPPAEVAEPRLDNDIIEFGGDLVPPAAIASPLAQPSQTDNGPPAYGPRRAAPAPTGLNKPPHVPVLGVLPPPRKRDFAPG